MRKLTVGAIINKLVAHNATTRSEREEVALIMLEKYMEGLLCYNMSSGCHEVQNMSRRSLEQTLESYSAYSDDPIQCAWHSIFKKEQKRRNYEKIN